jgi:hypothetical protein
VSQAEPSSTVLGKLISKATVSHPFERWAKCATFFVFLLRVLPIADDIWNTTILNQKGTHARSKSTFISAKSMSDLPGAKVSMVVRAVV